MVRPQTFRLVRPDDLLVVDVVTQGFEVRPNEAGPRGSARFALHVPEGGAGRLTLRLPPQELVEDPADGGQAVTTGPCESVVAVGPDDPPIGTTADGILDAARRLPRLVAEAEPARDPERPGTRFDRPYVLRLRLPGRSLQLVQEAQPGGLIGLWDAHVTVGGRTLPVRFDVPGYRTASGPWSSSRSTAARRGAARLPSSKNPVVVRARVSTP
jgi:hypothetical protein